ncbi:unnamed protein product, partial [Polarella glacialis]
VSKSVGTLAILRGANGRLRDLMGLPEETSVARRERRATTWIKEEKRYEEALVRAVAKRQEKQKGGIKKTKKERNKKRKTLKTGKKERRQRMKKGNLKKGR